MMGMSDLSKMFNPKSIAVVGASRDKKKIGGILLKNLKESGFAGKVYPVNPHARKIDGLKVYSDVMSLPEVPDLVVVAIPAQFVNEVLKMVGEKGTRDVVVFSAGYKEIGEEGKKLEEELKEVCRQYQINLVGPNCLGFVNNMLPVNVTFGQVVKNKGNLRFISQSGAIAAAIFDWFAGNGLGFSEFVTLGNKAVVGENEVLDYWLEETRNKKQETRNKAEEIEKKLGWGWSDVYPVGMYLESIVEGRKFIELVKETSKKDPVFVLKPGKSKAAAKAMQSHTGAIAGEDAVLDAALKQAGAVRCVSLEEMFDLSRAFSWERAPKGPNVVVVSNAGGPAVISADAITEAGLKLAPIGRVIRKRLTEVLPRAASLVNPVDVLGDALAERYYQALDIVVASPKVDAVVVILTPQVMTQIEKTAMAVGEMSHKYGKPIMCSFMGGGHTERGEKILNRYRVPAFEYPERAIRALARMYEWNQWRQSESSEHNEVVSMTNNQAPITKQYQNSNDQYQNEAGQVVATATSEGRGVLDSKEAEEILKTVRIRVPESMVVETCEQAREFAGRVGYPVVLKMIGEKMLHKTEVGGVVTNIGSDGELGKKWEEMWKRKLQVTSDKLQEKTQGDIKFLVQKQVNRGVEVIVGVKRDANFGPVLMFGAGGTMAELIRDRNLWVLPIDKEETRRLIEGSKAYKLLNGFRGEEPYSLDELVELVEKLAGLAESSPEISDIEINPVIVNREGTWAVDGKVLLQISN